MNLKIAVLEDKENDYRILESALKIWSEGSGNRIELFWYQTGNEMLKSFEQDGFDILFSDIELEENETGLTFCGRLRELGYSGEIIFLTAFREYVFRGYDVRALHYLLKPITQENLSVCMDKYLTIHAGDFYYFHKENDIVKIRYYDMISSAKYSANCCMVLFERTIIAMSELSAPALSNSLTASAVFCKVCAR